MSGLIIEDKNALDSLANAIIGANKSISDSSATKSELIEMINNIVPKKSKLSSGVVIPATEITAENMPEIPFNLGTDDNGNIIVPDMILIYQPQGVLENIGDVKAMLSVQIYPLLKPKGPTQEVPGAAIHTVKNTTGNKFFAIHQTVNNYLTETSFFLSVRQGYSWQAQMPIVWLQIKF